MEDKVRQFLNGHSADAIIKEENFRGEQQFTVKAEAVYGLCEALFQDNQLDVRLLADITCYQLIIPRNQLQFNAKLFHALNGFSDVRFWWIKKEYESQKCHFRFTVFTNN